MKKEVRILCVEDVPADVVLIGHALAEAGLHFSSRRVETKEAFLKELQSQPPDIILSDHGLPSFDGFMALAIARDKCPDVPFVFVTGALGEKMTIETFESGASDYVLKSNLSRLGPVVKKALRVAHKRKALKQKVRALRESEERFRILVDGVQDFSIIMLDPKGNIRSWNSGAERLHGYRVEEAIGRHFAMLYPPDAVEEGVPEMALRTAAIDGRFEDEGPGLGKNGRPLSVKLVITSLRDSASKLSGFAHVSWNNGSPGRTEEGLQKSELFKGAVLDSVHIAIIAVDEVGLVREWNLAAQKLFGYSRMQTVGRPADELIFPSSLRRVYHDGVASYLMTSAAALARKPVEMILRRADGTEFSAELTVSRTTTADTPRYTVVVRNLPQRRRSVASTREGEARLRMLVDGAKDYAIYLLDANGCVSTWNSGAERLTGYKTEEIVGKPLATFFTPEDVALGVPKGVLEKAEREGKSRYVGWRLRKDGERFWVDGTVTALRDENGKICGFSKVAHDITQQKLAEEEVRRLTVRLEERVHERTRQLEALNRELEAFSYSVSHDLRAPLRHISGYVEILQQEAAPKLSEESRGYLQTIAEGARRMGLLIDGLLDFSRMGRVEMRRQTVRLTDLVAEAQRILQREMENRDIGWNVHKLPEVQGDPILLQQVILNLLSNALKYTGPRAKVKIEIGVSVDEIETVIFIRDNGVGFDMQYAEKLFGVFQRLHSMRDFEGIGIGLANVRLIVTRHGGRVWAESTPGVGATFYFSIPHQAKEDTSNDE
jgi:PAS domain S-box-containing protein